MEPRSCSRKIWDFVTGGSTGSTLDYRGLRLANVNGPGTTTHGYLEYFNKAIEESVKGRPYSIYVEPCVWIPILHINDAVRAFVEVAEAPKEVIRTVNYTVLGPTPAPTAQQLVNAIKARVPGANVDFEVDPRISALIQSLSVKPFDDHCAREEWGWKYRFDLCGIIDSCCQSRQVSMKTETSIQ